MKNLLPYLGALALVASIVIATHDQASAQTPQTTSPPADISQVYLIHGLVPSANPGGVIINKENGFSIQLRANEFLLRQKDNPGTYRVPMSAVGWYKVSGEE